MCCLTTITDSTKTRNYASKIIFVPHFTEKINFVKMLTHPPPFDSNFSCGIRVQIHELEDYKYELHDKKHELVD